MLPGAVLLACAIGVAPSTMTAIVRVESGGNPLAIHVNKWAGAQPVAGSAEDAVAAAQRFIRMGYSVDLGWSQINSRNLTGLGYSVADAFDGCKNLAGGARILSAAYSEAIGRYGEGQRALMAALSAYNTGSLVRGFENGYVARYYIDAPVTVATAVKPIVAPAPFTTVVYERPGFEGALN